jgi:hypothetical protein
MNKLYLSSVYNLKSIQMVSTPIFEDIRQFSNNRL